MGCIHSARAHLNEQTEAIINNYKLKPSIVAEAYGWFAKLRAKVDYNRSPLEIRQNPTTTIKFQDVRASLGVPYSPLSDHLLDLIIDSIDEHEALSFPMFLELLTVFALASNEQLMVYAYHSFPLEGGYLSIDDFSEALTDLSKAYPQIVNGRALAVTSFVIVARAFLDESNKHSPGDRSKSASLTFGRSSDENTEQDAINQEKFDFKSFNTFFRRHGWLLDELRVFQLTVHRKLGGTRVWKQQRTESTIDAAIGERIDQRIKHQRSNKVKHIVHRRRQSMFHARRASTLPSSAISTGRRPSVNPGLTGRRSVSFASTDRINSISKSPPVSRLGSFCNDPVVPQSILKKKQSPRPSVSLPINFTASSSHPTRQESLSLPGTISSSHDRSPGLSHHRSSESGLHPTHSRFASTNNIVPPPRSVSPAAGVFKPGVRSRAVSKEKEIKETSVAHSPSTSQSISTEIVLVTDAGGYQVCEVRSSQSHVKHVRSTSAGKHQAGSPLPSHAEEPDTKFCHNPTQASHPVCVSSHSSPSMRFSLSVPTPHPDDRLISPNPRRATTHNHHVSRSHDADAHLSLCAVGAASLNDEPSVSRALVEHTVSHKKAPSESYLRQSLIGSDSAASYEEEQLVRLLQTQLPRVPSTTQLTPLTSTPSPSLEGLQRHSASINREYLSILQPPRSRAHSTSTSAARPVIRGRPRSSSVMC